MNDQVEQVKQKSDIVELIGQRVTLKKAGRHFKGLCPFHSEKSPSFIVSPERQSYKCFGCFPAGALIKTKNGLVPIEKIGVGDQVLSGNGVLRRVERLLERDYEGELSSIKLRKLSGDVTMTDDHQVLVLAGAPYTRQYKNFSKRYKKYILYKDEKYFRLTEKYFPIVKRKAGELVEGNLLLYPINQEVKDIKILDVDKHAGDNKRGLIPRQIPKVIEVDDSLLKLIGYYIAEGSNHRAYIRFSLSNQEENFAIEIINLIESIFGLKASIYRRSISQKKTGIEVTCCNAKLARLFESLCGKGAENKHIPHIWDYLPPSKQRVILEAIWRGDGTDFIGSKTNHINRAITTTSRDLSVQLRDILLRLGYFPTEHSSKEKIDQLGVNHRTAYTIQWSESGYTKYNDIYRTKSGERYWILPISRIIKSRYNDKVYNFTVDVDHSYIPENFSVGNCGEGGDVISFLQKYEGMSFLEALESLAKKAGIVLDSYRPSSQDEAKKRQLSIMDLAAQYYHYLLTEHRIGNDASKYLRERGINNEARDHFNLGFAPNNWRSVSDYLIKKKGFGVDELVSVGLVIVGDKGYYDRFRGRVMFPLKDHKGSVVGFSGRALLKDDQGAKYINSPETPIYSKSKMLYGLYENREYIRKADRIVIVEGELDMIPSWQVGIKEVVAIKGSAFTDEQARLVGRYTKNVLFALDSDSAGQEAIKRAVRIADPLELSIRVVQVVGGKDPGDVATEDAGRWKEMVKGSVLFYDFLINSATKKIDPKTGEGAKQVAGEVIPVLSEVSNLVVQAHYVGVLAKKIGIPEGMVYEEIERVKKKKELKILSETVKNIEQSPKKRREKVEERLLALMLQNAELTGDELVGRIDELFETPSIAKIIERRLAQEEKYKISTFVEQLPPELRSVVDDAYLLDLSELSTVEAIKQEYRNTLEELMQMALKEGMKKLTPLISAAEASGDKDKLMELQERFVKLTKKMQVAQDLK